MHAHILRRSPIDKRGGEERRGGGGGRERDNEGLERGCRDCREASRGGQAKKAG